MIDFSGLFMMSPKYKISAHPHQSRISLIEELGIIKEMRDLVGKAESMKKNINDDLNLSSPSFLFGIQFKFVGWCVGTGPVRLGWDC
jgi:hypothetical protein